MIWICFGKHCFLEAGQHDSTNFYLFSGSTRPTTCRHLRWTATRISSSFRNLSNRWNRTENRISNRYNKMAKWTSNRCIKTVKRISNRCNRTSIRCNCPTLNRCKQTSSARHSKDQKSRKTNTTEITISPNNNNCNSNSSSNSC